VVGVRILTDPKLFNVLIMALYACAIVAHGAKRNWSQCLYWTCALGLTLNVTFFLNK
jgi:hypothetical protein